MTVRPDRDKGKLAKGGEAKPEIYDLGPEPDLGELTLEAWVNCQLPPRDYLLGKLLCTTSRWLLIGDTGLGKTLVAMEMAASIASGHRPFLKWMPSGKPRVVMYIDGEMPPEMFKERMTRVASMVGGKSVRLYGYNRLRLEDRGVEIPPFDTDQGVAWLMREISRVKPDLIVFDSIMCLIEGSVATDEGWKPVLGLVRELTRLRIAQIWVHHTGWDASRGFGTKTREWQFDTVLLLGADTDRDADLEAKVDGEDTILMHFTKNRMKTPENRSEYDAYRLVKGDTGIRTVGEPLQDGKAARKPSGKSMLKSAFCNAYDRLADGVPPSDTVNGYKILKVRVERLRDELKSTGFLDCNEKGSIDTASRSTLRHVKTELLSSKGGFTEADGWIWRNRPSKRLRT
jgi:hypothetical protein